MSKAIWGNPVGTPISPQKVIEKTNVDDHMKDLTKHVTAEEKKTWNDKQPSGDYALKSEIPKKPSDVGADASGTAASKVSEHNTSEASHNDIRLLIEGLTNRLNALANSDDTTLDQMAEVVAYIKNNKSLIDGITTNKVNVSDIIDNLTTSASNKPLSAKQGVALKALIDAIVVPTKTSQLTNDSGFLTQHQSLTGYAKTADHYTKTESDNKYQPKGSYLTSVPSEYVTETELTSKGYLTQHQDISGKANKSGWTPNMIIGTDANGNMVARVNYTEAEKSALIQEIVDNIKVEFPDAHVIYGDVGSGNVITIFGELPDGSYTLKYEKEDGTVTEIGALVLSSYTNQIPISIDTDGSVYNGTGYKERKRFGSSGAEGDLEYPNSTNAPFITGFIPCKQGDVIRLKNCYIPTADGGNDLTKGTNSYGNAFWGMRSGLYNASKTKVNVFSWGTLIDNDKSILKDYTSVNNRITQFTIAQSGVSFIRLCLAHTGSPANAILTVNEEIK